MALPLSPFRYRRPLFRFGPHPPKPLPSLSIPTILLVGVACSFVSVSAAAPPATDRESPAQAPNAPSRVQANVPIPPAISRRLATHFPKPAHRKILDFYREHGPHFVLELDSRCLDSAERGAAYFSELQARWLRIQSAREQNQAAYAHLMSVLSAQNECIGLARRIRHIRTTIEERGKRGQLGDRLLSLEKRLMEQLAAMFTKVQQHHAIELQRLESELFELKRLIRQRDLNRNAIITSQFNELLDQ